jgi:hypothetical protein
MIEFLIILTVKVIVAEVVGEVKKETYEIPLRVTDQIVAKWDGDEKELLKKLWNWVHFEEDAVDAREVIRAACSSLKSTGIEGWFDKLELVKAVGETGKSLSDIVNDSKPVKSKIRHDSLPYTKYIIVPQPKPSKTRRAPKKRNAGGKKKVNNSPSASSLRSLK